MDDWTIRDVDDGDVAAVRELNAANQPEVGPLDDERLARLRDEAARFQVVIAHGLVAGLFVGLVEDSGYASPNYRWFDARHDRFAYVDRIALAPVLRGRGVADALYEDFEQWARETSRAVVCAEVNTVPPNPRSLQFHRRRDYIVVEEVAPYGGDERVAMVEKSL